MAKRKTPAPSSSNDTTVAAVVLGVFVAAIILFSLFHKHKPERHPVPPPQPPRPEMVVPVRVVPETEASRPAEPVPFNVPGAGGKIAIIIDDWGQTTWNCKYLHDIPDPLAVSILPGLRHTKDVAACAGLYHKVVMLHLPLEAMHNYDFYPPNYIIKTSMPPELASKVVDEDMAQLPTMEGVNNHMGSKATGDRSLMKLIFKKVKRKGLFFVDSVTIHGTVCAALADEMHVPFARRDVFLDNINTREAITKQMLALAKFARRHGYAVAIGHDRRLTMQVLKDEIPRLKAEGFQIVSIKDLLRNQ